MLTYDQGFNQLWVWRLRLAATDQLQVTKHNGRTCMISNYEAAEPLRDGCCWFGNALMGDMLSGMNHPLKARKLCAAVLKQLLVTKPTLRVHTSGTADTLVKVWV